MNNYANAKNSRSIPRPASMPLQGVKVLAIEQFAAGPYGTMYLAQMGADVVKIENPASRGDPARRIGPCYLGADDSQYFQGWNTNNRDTGTLARAFLKRRSVDIRNRQGD